MENVKEIINKITSENTRVAASQKDEVLVMKAMLNDRDYKVTVYDRNGPTDNTVNPSDCARNIASNILSNAAGIPKAEANGIVNDYEFTKSDAENMINISKQFIHTYLETGRKLPLGGREKSNISLVNKTIPETIKGIPVNSGTDDQGNPIWTTKSTVRPEHNSIKVISPCPNWLK